MPDEITLTTVLEHIQALRYDLTQRIDNLDKRLTNFQKSFTNFQEETRSNFAEVNRKIDIMQLDIQAVTEDHYATMRMVHRHEKKLAKI